MMKSISHIFFYVALLIASVTSCTQELDFNQIDAISAEPILEGSIIYIEVPERSINLASEATFFTQEYNFDAFSADIFAERVLEGTITYEIENTTSKELEVRVEFLDEEGNVLDLEDFAIDPAPYIEIEEVDYGGGGKSIEIIKNLSGFRVSAINSGGTTSVSDIPDAKITLKTKGTFKVRAL